MVAMHSGKMYMPPIRQFEFEVLYAGIISVLAVGYVTFTLEIYTKYIQYISLENNDLPVEVNRCLFPC